LEGGWFTGNQVGWLKSPRAQEEEDEPISSSGPSSSWALLLRGFLDRLHRRKAGREGRREGRETPKTSWSISTANNSSQTSRKIAGILTFFFGAFFFLGAAFFFFGAA